jgi:hypothetical protein
MHSMVQMSHENPVSGFTQFVRRVCNERGLSARQEDPKASLAALLQLVHASLSSGGSLTSAQYLEIRDLSVTLMRKCAQVNKGIARCDEARRLKFPTTLYEICKIEKSDASAVQAIRLLVNRLRSPLLALDHEIRVELGIEAPIVARAAKHLQSTQPPASPPPPSDAIAATKSAPPDPPPGLVTSERTQSPHVPSMSDPSSGAPHGGFGRGSFEMTTPQDSPPS